MTLAAADIPFEGSEHLVLDDVPWDVYEDLLRAIGDRPIRVTYFQGRLEIMSPLYTHEKWKKLLGRLVEMMTLELQLPLASAGSTTFRRQERKAGLEPDECYYIQNAPAVLGKDRLELPADPPPDLAVEVDITRRSVPRQPIYAALGVPELWRFDGKRLEFLKLNRSGKYVRIERSLAFGFLTPGDLQPFLDRVRAEDENAVIRSFQQWVRTLKP